MDLPYRIRDFNPGDFDSLLDLWEKTEMGGAERGDGLEIIKKTLNLGGRLLVMLDGPDGVIGSSWLTHDGRRMFIHHFAIHPDYQGRGLSKQLLEKSLEHCRAIGLQVKLEVHRENYKALNLYKGYGFKELDNCQVYIIRDI